MPLDKEDRKLVFFKYWGNRISFVEIEKKITMNLEYKELFN